MHVFILFIESQYSFSELWKPLISSHFLSLKSRTLLKTTDHTHCVSLKLSVFLSLGAIRGMPKPKAGRGISYKWAILQPVTPRPCW